MRKRILALILTLTMVLSFLPLSYISFAEEQTTEISVASDVYAIAGATVDVDIVIKNNPGIAGAKFTLSYNSKLTLTGAVSGEAFADLDYTRPGVYTSPCNFTWDSESAEATADGTVLTLTFAVAADAVAGENLNVDLAYTYGDIYTSNLDSVGVNFVNNSVEIIDYLPGDVNGDNTVNGKDVTLVRRYNAGGYDVEINTNAADVNDDNTINGKDITLIRRYNAGGYGVKLLPHHEQCKHTLVKVAAVESDCRDRGNIEYWQCSECEKCFADEYGETEITLESTLLDLSATHKAGYIVIDPAVPATTTTTGLTEGSHCEYCHKTIVAQEVTPVVVEYSITYRLVNNDDYLAQQTIDNPNPSGYTSEQGVELSNDISVPGYTFVGWFDSFADNATQIKEIPKNTAKNVTLYAHWTKTVYTINFDSPDVPIDSVTYTVDTGKTLINAEWYGYTFVGWSNDDGFILNKIPVGTTGNITLHANWTSNRNRATSYSSYASPLIIEDNKNGQFIFVYDIGKIDNVPLSQIEYIGNSQKIEIDAEYDVSNYISSEDAKTVANMVSNTTTRSSSWTLSSDWNEIYGATTEEGEVYGKSKIRTDSEGNTVGGNYFVSNSEGGASYTSVESGASNESSSKVTTDKSYGINKSYDNNTQTYADMSLGIKNETEVSAGVSLPVDIVKVSAGVKNTTTVEANVSSGRKDDTSYHSDSSASAYVGTVNTNNSSSYFNATQSNSTNWNTETSYTSSYNSSRDTAVSNAISEEISKTTTYNIDKALGGSDSKSEEDIYSSTSDTTYSNAFKYSEGTTETTKKSVKFSSDRPGYYRLVEAGTVHVYGVVGYDVATSSYFAYSYSVLDNERHEYLDYSKDNANFNDCENGLVIFNIPIEVNNYIAVVTGRTSGLEVDLNGSITKFDTPQKFDGTVQIPDYYSTNNQDDTFSAYQTKSITAGLFKGNTEIKDVILPDYITEIPESAFEGCTNLERIVAYGVTSIGKNAFYGCTALKEFSIDNKITFIGENAFKDVSAISVMAASESIVDATLNSGAKKITLNVSLMQGSLDNKELIIDDSHEYFGLISDGRIYTNLKLVSDATETFISNIKFDANEGTPIKSGSEIITLARTSVSNSGGFALISTAENALLKLYGDIIMQSVTDNVVITKNVTLAKADEGVSGRWIVDGDYYICGSVTNDALLLFKVEGVTENEGKLITVDETEFSNKLTTNTVTFDANEGSVDITSKTVTYASCYGDLPVPKRTGYVFDGWYTDKTAGTKIEATTTVNITAPQTLYAHWTAAKYTVTFDANGGSVSTSSKSVTYASTYGDLPTPTKTGYVFDGWYTDKTAGTKIVSTTAVSITAAQTLYAHWTASKYTVTFNANGGSVSTSSKSVTYASTYGDLPTPTKTGYVFDGWYTDKTAGTKVISTTTVNITAAQTLYAHWSAAKYTVTFNANGGSVSTSSKSVTYASTYGDLPTPTRTGYAFSGWYTDKTAGTKVTSSTTVNITAAQTLYAHWSVLSYTYNIVYKSKNGTSLGSSKATYNYGTTNTITPPGYGGYDTPSAQKIAWDSVSAKTITFTYTPSNVGYTGFSGTIYSGVTYSGEVQYRNRTASSVEIKVDWTSTIAAYSYNTYGHHFYASCGGVSTGTVTVVSFGDWKTQVSYARSSTNDSGWITVPLSTTNKTSVSVYMYYWQTNYNGTNMIAYGESDHSTTVSVAIPAY